jgi:CRP/FNR family cyclic AMP-dependent transcriptional regulator
LPSCLNQEYNADKTYLVLNAIFGIQLSTSEGTTVELIKLLSSVEMFSGLSEEQLAKLAGIFEERELKQGEVLFSQGDEGDRLYLVREGFVEVIVSAGDPSQGRIIVNLGPGQSVGEMALIDRGARSATVRAATDHTVIASVSREAFESLCENNTEIGYRIMRNIAADLSFKLRHRDLKA